MRLFTLAAAFALLTTAAFAADRTFPPHMHVPTVNDTNSLPDSTVNNADTYTPGASANANRTGPDNKPLSVEKLTVTDVWAMANTPASGPVKVIGPKKDETIIYMTLTNKNLQPVIITSFSSPIAKHVMAHETKVTGGVARMNPLTPLTLTPNKPFVFANNGAHMMVDGMFKPLAPGDKFPLIIGYSDGTVQTVEVVAKR